MHLNNNTPKGIVYVSSESPAYKTYRWTDFNGKDVEQPYVSAADHSFVLNTLKGLTGRVLTLVEASCSDKEQRKAMKDIVKMIFSEEMNHVSSIMFSKKYNDDLCAYADDYAAKHPEEFDPSKLVDIEDIIRDTVLADVETPKA